MYHQHHFWDTLIFETMGRLRALLVLRPFPHDSELISMTLDCNLLSSSSIKILLPQPTVTVSNLAFLRVCI